MRLTRAFALPVLALLPLALITSASAAGSVTSAPTADVFVSSASPTSSGNTATLQVDYPGPTGQIGDATRIAYMKFNVRNVPDGAPITGVRVRVTGVQSQTAQVVDLHAVGDTWSETTTWDTRPALGALLASATVSSGVVTTFTLPASAVAGNGVVSFALARQTSGGQNVVASSEYTTTSSRPKLVVNYGDAPTPTPTPTATSTPTPTPTPTPEPTPTPTTEPPPAPVSGLPYGADSFFQSDTAGLPVDSASTSAFRSFMATFIDQKAITWPKINLNAGWSGHNHIGTTADPVWKLTGTNSGISDTRLGVVKTQGVHLADDVWDTVPTGTQDRLLVVIDPVFGYTVQCADVVPNRTARTWTASNCGVFWHSSNGLDYRNPKSNDARNYSSRGRIPDAMQVPRSELDAAVAANRGLGRVMHLFFVETNTAAGFVHPMVGTESGNAGWGAEGVRIGIDRSVDLAARGLTGATLALARTLQDNGAYIGDNSGSATQVKVGPPGDYVGTNLATDAFKGKLSWNDFVVYQAGSQ